VTTLLLVLFDGQANDAAPASLSALRTGNQPVTKIWPGTELTQNLDVGMSPAGQHEDFALLLARTIDAPDVGPYCASLV
jgi:hypothetical protein